MLNRKPFLFFGIALMVIGTGVLGYDRISHANSRTMRIVSPAVTAEKDHAKPVSPLLGGLALAIGVSLVAQGYGPDD